MSISSHMRRAIGLAAAGNTRPNPQVGAVLVHHGQVIGQGRHLGPGSPHAEVAAIQDALSRGQAVAGASLYVTLEPCCHQGNGKRTPPCVPFLIRHRLAQVHCATIDPNPLVQGRGIAALRQAGIAVSVGDGGRLAARLNLGFAVNMLWERAAVHLKWAQTLDGCLADQSGSSRWITGPAARRAGHALRARSAAILVGAGTLRQDNPALTVRHVTGPDPVPVILAGRQALPPARLLEDSMAGRTLVAARPGSPAWQELSRRGWPGLIPWTGDWTALWTGLYRRGLDSVLVEGGAGILGAILAAGAWDQASVFTAPRLVGTGLRLQPGTGLALDQALQLDWPHYRRVGPDSLVTGLRDTALVEGWLARGHSIGGAPCSPD